GRAVACTRQNGGRDAYAEKNSGEDGWPAGGTNVPSMIRASVTVVWGRRSVVRPEHVAAIRTRALAIMAGQRNAKSAPASRRVVESSSRRGAAPSRRVAEGLLLDDLKTRRLDDSSGRA